MLRKVETLLTVTLPIIILAIAFLALYSHAAVADSQTECNIDQDLQGTLNKNHAVVTNYSTNSTCIYKATLALYDVPLAPGTPRWIDTQTLLKSQTVTVDPGKTVEVAVDAMGPSCRVQTDLIRGEDLLEPPFYANAMDVAVYEIACAGGEVTPPATPTPTTPVVTNAPTPAPTSTPTPGPTSTPGPGPTGTPTPQSSNSQSSVKGVLALTGNAAFIYALILSGAASLILGLILKKFSK